MTRESHKQIQIVRGSFLGIAVLSVLQVLNGVQLDKFVFISIFFFALGIPFLAFSFLIEWAFLGSSGAKELELPEICQWFLGLGIFAVVLGLVFLFFHLSLWLEGVFLICCCFLVIPVSLIFGFVGLPLELEKVKTKLTSEQMKKVEAGIWFLTGVKRAHDLFESGCILESEILSVWFLRVEQGKELEQLCELRKSGVLS